MAKNPIESRPSSSHNTEISSLRCGVVGAGIAGLAAALALRRAGHNVEIFEKSSFKSEIGAAISITPNANLILDHWGFDPDKARETDKSQSRRVHSETLECVAHLDLSGVRKIFGHGVNTYHRVDLHNGLRELVTSSAQPGKIPKINLDYEAIAVDCENGILKFKNGIDVKKDLIVIADGMKSQLTRSVVGVDVPLMKCGKSVYRTLIPMEKVMGNPLVRSLFEYEPSGFLTTLHSENGVFLVSYPCRNDEVMNVAIFHDTREDQEHSDDWNSPASVKDAVDQVTKEGFHPLWKQFIELANSMKCYTIGIRDTLPHYVSCKAVIIGDAAHPMQPTHAQGGSMALEDAAAFEKFFSPEHFNPCQDSVEDRLDLWNQFRLSRDCVAQLIGNGMFYGVDIHERIQKIRTYYSGPIPAAPLGRPIWDFYYGYNVFAESEKALKYKDAEGGIPQGVIEHFGLQAGAETINW